MKCCFKNTSVKVLEVNSHYIFFITEVTLTTLAMCIYVILIETKIIYVISIEFKYENLNEWGGGGVKLK